MAGKIVGITIDIAGNTSPLVSGLKSAESELTKTNSALKNVNSALKFDGNNLELLTSKSELLGNAIAQNSSKLEVLKATAAQAMETLGQEGGTTTEQMAELQAEISRTEQTLAGLETEAANTNAAMENIAGGAPEDLEELSDGSEEAAEDLQEVEEESGNAGVAIEAMGATAAAVGAAMVAAFGAAVEAAKEVGAALVGTTVDAAHYSDELLTMSTTTGLSVETLQELNYAAELMDTDVSTITGSMIKLEKSMDAAREGTGAAAESYAALGIAVTNEDGTLRDSEAVFWEVIDALGTMEEGTERNMLAQDLLGKSSRELNNLIAVGSEGFASLAEEAKNTGYVMSDETVEKFGALDDQLVRLSNGTTAAKNALGTVLLPTLTNLAGSGTDLLNKFTVKVNESGGDIGKIGDAVSELLPELFADINEQLPEIFGLIGTVTETLGQILIDNLPMLLDSALQIVETLTTGLLAPDNIAKISDAAFNLIFSLADFLLSNLDKILSAAAQILTSLVSGLALHLPEIIPVAIDAILTFVDTLLSGDQLGQILEASLTLITSLATGLIDYLPRLIDRLPEIITGMVEFLTGDALPDIIEAGVTLLMALVTNLPEIITGLLGAAGDLITSLFDYFTGDGAADMAKAFTEIFDGIGELFAGLIEDAVSWGGDMIEGFIDGITGVAGDLWSGLEDIGSGIVSMIGFSVPEKGPLSHADEWGPDFVDLFAQGIDDEMPTLQTSLNLMANTIAQGAAPGNYAPDYTGSLESINSGIAGLAASGNNTINVYIGDERIGSVVANANASNALISGGY